MNIPATIQENVDHVQAWIDDLRGEQTALREAWKQSPKLMRLSVAITKNCVLISQAEKWLADWRAKISSNRWGRTNRTTK